MLNTIKRLLKAELNHKRKNNKASLKDIQIIVKCYIKEDYKQAHQTKLYINHGGAYCTLLELIEAPKIQKLINQI